MLLLDLSESPPPSVHISFHISAVAVRVQCMKLLLQSNINFPCREWLISALVAIYAFSYEEKRDNWLELK